MISLMKLDGRSLLLKMRAKARVDAPCQLIESLVASNRQSVLRSVVFMIFSDRILWRGLLIRIDLNAMARDLSGN